MGYIRHDAILVTSSDQRKIIQAANKAEKLGLEVLGPSTHGVNNYTTILICPDGSKEGWLKSEEVSIARKQYIEYLNGERYADNSSSLEWVAVAYGNNDYSASITNHTWEMPLID